MRAAAPAYLNSSFRMNRYCPTLLSSKLYLAVLLIFPINKHFQWSQHCLAVCPMFFSACKRELPQFRLDVDVLQRVHLSGALSTSLLLLLLLQTSAENWYLCLGCEIVCNQVALLVREFAVNNESICFQFAPLALKSVKIKAVGWGKSRDEDLPHPFFPGGHYENVKGQLHANNSFCSRTSSIRCCPVAVWVRT